VTATFNRVTGGVNAADAGRNESAPTTERSRPAADPFGLDRGPSTSGVPSYAGQSNHQREP